jgi:tripartite-type tricarboxylate transporter receptor subunit TctC
MKRLLIVILSVFILLVMVNLENKILAAEKYPVKPIIFIISIGPGSDMEIMMRPWLQKASDILGKPIVIVHKPGAGHTIGYREIYAAKPDGYTIGAMLGSMLSVKMQGLLPYDYHDYTIINFTTAMYPIIVASKKTKRPFKTIEEVFAFAKSNPGEVTIATTPVGQTWWVATMYFQEKTGFKFNIIPQEEGAGMAVTQVAGGHADIGIFGLTAAKAQIDAGNLHLLASISPHRAREPYNNAPTLKEVGYDIIFRGSAGFIGPPKMPKDIVDKLANTFEIALNDPEIKKHIISCDQIPMFMRSDEAIKYLDAEIEIMRKIMAKAGLLKEK